MSGVSVIRYTLANNAPVTSVVPATRIMAGVLPLSTTLPAIAVLQISGSTLKHINQSASEFVTERVQVSVLATTYAQQKTILALIKTALPSVRATVNGVIVDSISQEFTGPDLYNNDPVVYEQSVDYFVKYIV